MLPGVGGTELVVIALVALIVVGPKDLPVLMRKIGQWMHKIRVMASDFRASFDEMARQSELDELRKEVEALRRGDPIDPLREDMHSFHQDLHGRIEGTEHAGDASAVNHYPSPDWREDLADKEPAPLPIGMTPAEPVPAKPARKPRAPRKATVTPVEVSEPLAAKPARRRKTAAPKIEI